MPRLTLDLSDDLQSKLKVRAADGGYATVEQYVQALLRSDAETSDLPDEDYGAPPELTVTSPEDLEAKILEGLSSPAREMTATDWDEMRQEVAQRLAARRVGQRE
jgi:antitoxin ParD1/3/4